MVDNIDRRHSEEAAGTTDRSEHTRKIEQTYDDEAHKFDTKAPKLLTWVHIVEPAINRNLAEIYKRAPDLKVLDVGCADGRVIEVHLANGVQEENIIGVELSGKQVKIAREKFPEANIIHGDISTTELPKTKFDLVSIMMVLEFLTADQLDDTLKSIYKSMKPGATLMFVSTHPKRVENRYGLSPDHEGPIMTEHPWGSDKYPNWHRSVNRYVEQTRAAGFDIEVIEELEMPQAVVDTHPEFNTFNAPARLVVVARKP